MRKWMLVGLSVVLVISIIAGCSGGSSNSGSNAEGGQASGGSGNAQKPTKLTMWLFNDVNLGYWEEMEKAYNLENPDDPIDLVAEPYPYEEMHNKLQIAVQSGVGAPDIADVEVGKFPNFLRGNIPFMDLTPIVEPVRDKFVQSRFDLYSKEGKVYGLPLHVGATFMFYNKDILAQAGVNADDIRTWNDFAEAGKQVKAATGKPMTTVEVTDSNTFYPLIKQQKSDYFDKDGNVIIHNETNVRTLEFLDRMVNVDKIAIPAPGGNHHAEEFYSFFNQGGSASLMMPMWYMLRFVNYMPELQGKILIKPLPRWTEDGNRSAGIGGTGTVVMKSSPQAEKAVKFLEFAKLSVTAQKAVWTILGFDPPRLDVWDSEEMKVDNRFTQYFQQNMFDVLLEIKDEIESANVVEGFVQAHNLVGQELMFKVIRDRSKTPEEGLNDVAEALRK